MVRIWDGEDLGEAETGGEEMIQEMGGDAGKKHARWRCSRARNDLLATAPICDLLATIGFVGAYRFACLYRGKHVHLHVFVPCRKTLRRLTFRNGGSTT